LAFAKRKKYVAAYACIRDALEAGVPQRELSEELRTVETALGVGLTGWKAKLVESKGA